MPDDNLHSDRTKLALGLGLGLGLPFLLLLFVVIILTCFTIRLEKKNAVLLIINAVLHQIAHRHLYHHYASVQSSFAQHEGPSTTTSNGFKVTAKCRRISVMILPPEVARLVIFRIQVPLQSIQYPMIFNI